MDIITIALCGIGISMLWCRAVPITPIKDFVIIKLNRIYEMLVVRKMPSYPVWLLKGMLSCEACATPWFALLSGLIIGSWFNSIIAMPISFAIYTLLIKEKL